ncbi:MAG TPA: hypothetical protein VL173_16760 [Vicinamibacterales bacterium]|nr:hypothetical protein [Vicinamibacterales bacterium]
MAFSAALMLWPALADRAFAQGAEAVPQGQGGGGQGRAAGQGNRGRGAGAPGGAQGQGGGAAAQGRGGGRGNAAPARPTPRWPDGTVNWGAPIGETGLWNVAGGTLARPDGSTLGPNDPPKPMLSEIPFQPWARAIYDYRQENQLEPYTRCKPSGAFRQVATAYGTQFVNFPELKQFIIFQTGGSHSFRTIYMDGRQHPKNLAPSYYGDSIGHFEGDTLVVDTVGYNERMWISNLEGIPHSEKLHTIERFTRTDMNNMRYELTIDDPGAYTATWKTAFDVRFSPGESFEFVCQDGNQAFDLMVGSLGEVDRSSPFVP